MGLIFYRIRELECFFSLLDGDSLFRLDVKVENKVQKWDVYEARQQWCVFLDWFKTFFWKDLTSHLYNFMLSSSWYSLLLFDS